VYCYITVAWALTEAQAEKLDAFQRKMLGSILGIKWFDKVTNAQVYERGGMTPISELVINARWRLFGHTLRMNEDTPARKAMAYYFCKDLPGRKGNRVTIASVLSNEYKASFGTPINTLNAYSKLVDDAQDRALWRERVDKIVNDQRAIYESKVQRKAERRHEAKRKREEDSITLDRATSGRRRRV